MTKLSLDNNLKRAKRGPPRYSLDLLEPYSGIRMTELLSELPDNSQDAVTLRKIMRSWKDRSNPDFKHRVRYIHNRTTDSGIGDVHGRLWPQPGVGNALQLTRRTRGRLLQDLVRDFDQESAYPTLFAQILRENATAENRIECQNLDTYAADRDAIFARLLAENSHLRRNELKVCATAILHLTDHYRALIGGVEDEFLSNLSLEMKINADKLSKTARYAPFYAFVKRLPVGHKVRHTHFGEFVVEKNKLATFVSFVCQHAERKVTLAFGDFLTSRHIPWHTYMLDGLHAAHEHPNLPWADDVLGVEGFLGEASEYCFENTGYRVRWCEKPVKPIVPTSEELQALASMPPATLAVPPSRDAPLVLFDLDGTLGKCYVRWSFRPHVALLADLRAAGYSVGLWTNKSAAKLPEMLAALQLAAPEVVFDCVLSGETCYKPSLKYLSENTLNEYDRIKDITHRFGLDAREHVTLVEDTPNKVPPLDRHRVVRVSTWSGSKTDNKLAHVVDDLLQAKRAPIPLTAAPFKETYDNGIIWRQQEPGSELRYSGDYNYAGMGADWTGVTVREHPDFFPGPGVKLPDLDMERADPYLNPMEPSATLTRLHIMLLEALMGYGKTEAVVAEILSGRLGRCVILAPTRTLLAGLKTNLGPEFVVHYKDSAIPASLKHSSKHLVTTFQSLQKLIGLGVRFDTLVVDEIRTLCGSVVCTETNPRDMSEKHCVIRSLLSEVRRAIFMDADMSVDNAVPLFIRAFAPKSAVARLERFLNPDPRCRRKLIELHEMEFHSKLLAAMKEGVENGKSFGIANRTRAMLAFWAHEFTGLGAEGKVYCSNQLDSKDKGKLDDWATDALLRSSLGASGRVHYVLYTSSCAVGLSCTVTVEGVFLDFSGKGGPCGRILCQMIMRFRSLFNIEVHVTFGTFRASSDVHQFVSTDSCRQALVVLRKNILSELHLYKAGSYENDKLVSAEAASNLFLPDAVTDLSLEVARERKTDCRPDFYRIAHRHGFEIANECVEEHDEDPDTQQRREAFALLLKRKKKALKSGLKATITKMRLQIESDCVVPLWEELGFSLSRFKENVEVFRREVHGQIDPGASDICKLDVLISAVKYLREGQPYQFAPSESKPKADKRLNLLLDKKTVIKSIACYMRFDQEADRSAWLRSRSLLDATLPADQHQPVPRLAHYLDLEYKSSGATLFPKVAGLYSVCDALNLPRACLVDHAEAEKVLISSSQLRNAGPLINKLLQHHAERNDTKSPKGILNSLLKSTLGAALKEAKRETINKRKNTMYKIVLDQDLIALASASRYHEPDLHVPPQPVTTTALERRRAKVNVTVDVEMGEPAQQRDTSNGQGDTHRVPLFDFFLERRWPTVKVCIDVEMDSAIDEPARKKQKSDEPDVERVVSFAGTEIQIYTNKRRIASVTFAMK